MDAVGVSDEMVVEHVITVAAGKLPEGNVADARDRRLLHVDSLRVVLV